MLTPQQIAASKWNMQTALKHGVFVPLCILTTIYRLCALKKNESVHQVIMLALLFVASEMGVEIP